MTQTEKEIREEIGLEKSGEGHKNYSVKAGAGGGKTTLLSRRISRQIAQGTSVEKFAIITYTNAAAAELREKITERLQEMLKSDALEKSERANVTRALNSIELMQISTIHAFLLRILGEYAFEAGIAMDVRKLEDTEDEARKKEFFDKWYQKHFAEMEAYKDDWVMKEGTSSKYREVFENMFYATANVREEPVYDLSDHTADVEKAAEEYVKRWLGVLVNFKTELVRNRKLNKNGTYKELIKDSREIRDHISHVEAAESYGISEAKELACALKTMKYYIDNDMSFYGKAATNEPLICVFPEYPEYELEWNFEEFYETFFVNAQKAARVAKYVNGMRKKYQEEIDRETLVLSDDDILYRAQRLLTDHPEVLNALRDRYTKIYVDEFQDTTDLQTRIILLLSGKNTALSEFDLSEDKLLVVGDGKQSIYRFTGAEKEVYEKTDRQIDSMPDSCAKSVQLKNNFRSNKAIVDWVNDSFQTLIPGYAPMETDWTVTEPAALHGVYSYVSSDKTYIRETDVANVVELVRNLVNNPKYFLERTTRNGQGGFCTPVLEEIRYSDFMIICRNTKKMDIYAEKFAEAGIPVNVHGKLKVEDDEVLKNFVLLVEYFAGYKNRKKSVAAAQVLQGIDVAKVGESEWKQAKDRLRSLRKQLRACDMDSAAVVRQLLRHEEYFIPKGKAHKAERVRSYRIRLYQMVETCLGKNKGDLSALAELMKEYLATEVKREIPLESNENAIRLMNVHQAKGLTGQIVIIADRYSSEECKYGGFRKSGKYYPAAAYKKNPYDTVNVPTYGYDMSMLKQAYTDETEESIRLQYVAATRAAQALIIMPVCTTKNGISKKAVWFSDGAYKLSAQKDILKWLDERDRDTKRYEVGKAAKSISHSDDNLNSLSKNLDAADISKLSKAQLVSITPSGLEPAGATGYEPADARYKKEMRPGANVFGTVMHRVYELIFNRYASTRVSAAADQEKLIGRMINQAILEQSEELRENDDSNEFAAYLKPVMTNYLTKVIAPIVAEADEIYPEYAFSFFVPDEERDRFLKDFDKYFKTAATEIKTDSDHIWINGQADLVVKRKDGTVKVYDYKSDAMNGKPLPAFEKALAFKYEGQLALYKYAIGKAFGVTEVETELIHLYRS